MSHTGNLRIPVGSTSLTGELNNPKAPKAIVILASAGDNDSYAMDPTLIATVLGARGYATLTICLLTQAEQAEEGHSGRYHLDVALLSDRICLVLAAVRRHEELGTRPLGLFVEGMAAASGIISASRHQEVRAVVSWNGRADLADVTLGAVHAPVLLIVPAPDTHVADVNRNAARQLTGRHSLEILETPLTWSERSWRIGHRTANWFDQFLVDQAVDRNLEIESALR